MSRASFAYLFERFPSFTQTFCLREVREMERQGMRPAIYSIRRADDFPLGSHPEATGEIHYLPPDDELTAQIKGLQSQRKIPRPMNRALNEWGGKRDKHRVYAAAWLGPRLRARGIRHVHVHFAGMAARTAFWLKRFYGISYSFTAHANDVFCATDFPVTTADLVREAALVVTVSDFSREWLRERFPAHRAKIQRVYNGIDLAQFSRATLDGHPPLIASVGRYVEKKGFTDLIDACGVLRDEGVPFRCEIAGGGPLQDELAAKIETLGLGEHTALVGPRSEPEVRELLARATVFALPCVVEKDGGMDNLPTVIMEAMAAGLPVVSTRLAGVPEMVVDGETGALVAPGDVAALARSIGQIAEDRAQASRLGSAGRHVAEQKFSLPVTTRSLKRLLVSFGRVRPTIASMRADRDLLWAYLRLG